MTANNKHKKQFLPFIIALVAVCADQYTKTLARTELSGGSVPVVEGVFHLTYVENTGAAFGIFQNSNGFFIVLVSAILLGIIVSLYLLKPQSLLLKISAGLVMGGAAGNLIDRVFRGFVVDFLDFRIIRYPVFNLADMLVVTGAALICVHLIFFERKEESESADI